MSMIVIDMDMPKSCDECPLFDDRWDYPTCYVNQLSSGYTFPIRDKKMEFCPIKCNINDIKTEIKSMYHKVEFMDEYGSGYNSALDDVVEVINKHIGEKIKDD